MLTKLAQITVLHRKWRISRKSTGVNQPTSASSLFHRKDEVTGRLSDCVQSTCQRESAVNLCVVHNSFHQGTHSKCCVVVAGLQGKRLCINSFVPRSQVQSSLMTSTVAWDAMELCVVIRTWEFT